MSFSWAITDKRFERQPWKHETFNGYFTDIRRAARKSLPRRPNTDLCNILGLPLASERLERGIDRVDQRLSDSVSNAPVSLQPVVIQTANGPSDTLTKEKHSWFDKLKAALLCRTSRTENCSKGEKTVFGFAVYFAIIIFILLIIVLILSTTLSNFNDDDASNNARLVSTTASSVTTIKTTSPIKGSSSLLSSFKTTVGKSTNSFNTLISGTSSAPSKFTETLTSAYPEENGPKTATTTKASLSTNRKSSTLSILSMAFSARLTPPSKNAKTKTITANTKSIVSSEPSSASPPSSPSTAPSAASQTTNSVSTSKSTTKATSVYSFPSTTHTASTTVDSVNFPTLKQPAITCTSRTCLEANKTLSRADFDKSPCADFYEFSCGLWSEKLEAKKESGSARNIPESVQDELRQSLLLEIKNILQKTFREDESFSAKVTKRLFQSCTESNDNSQIVLAMQEVHALLDPLGMKADGSIQNSLEALLKEAVTIFEVTPFFKISPVTTLDGDSLKVHALKIEPPSVFLDHNVYRQAVDNGKDSFRYVEGLSKILFSYVSSFSSRRKRQTEEESSNSTPGLEEIFNRVLRTYYIEANISSILENTTTIGDVWYSTLHYTYSELKVIYPFVKWDAAVGQDRNFLVQLVEFEYFQALNNLWKSLNEDDMKLYVFMNILVKRVWAYMKFPFRRLLSNVGANGDMFYSEIDCVNIALDLASEEIHALYIGQFTQNVLNNRLKLTNLENKVSEVFLKFVSASTWIQPDLERAVTSLGKNLNMQFSSLRTNVRQTRNITGSAQSFLSLSVELHRQKYEVEMNRLGSEVTEIMVDWTSTLPKFDEYFNAIGLPTGLTVYLTNGDVSFDFYGYVGMAMAEEFIKVLTGQAKGGVPPPWWGMSSMTAFDTVTQCFSGQLSMFQNTYYDQSSVIISNGAFQVIDQVYFSTSSNTDNIIPGSNMTENMIFVINVAQLHCQLEDGSYERRLTKERINYILKNNVNFKRMFNCPDVSPMVTENRCSLFS